MGPANVQHKHLHLVKQKMFFLDFVISVYTELHSLNIKAGVAFDLDYPEVSCVSENMLLWVTQGRKCF